MQGTTTFEGAVEGTRANIKNIGAYLLELKKSVAGRDALEGEDKAEMIANITLAYRHIEDAAMRMGKALQAHNGGVSIYDKPKA